MQELIEQAINEGWKHLHPVYIASEPPALAYDKKEKVAYIYTPFSVNHQDLLWGRGHVKVARKVHECYKCQAEIGKGEKYIIRSEHSINHTSYKYCLACGVHHLSLWATTYVYNQEETPMKETQAVQTQDRPMPVDVEAALVQGDLSKLTEPQRISYYMHTCESLGLNPLTKPFAYIKIQGSLQLYARKDCTDQLRSLRHINIVSLERETIEGVFIVTATAKTPNGREDTSIGAVPIQGIKGEALANAMMKAETKAKRRVTLSICGLGFTDEAEVSSIPNAQIFQPVLPTKSADEEVSTQALEPLFQPLVEELRTLLKDLSDLEGGEYLKKLDDFEQMMKVEFPVNSKGVLITNSDLENRIDLYGSLKAESLKVGEEE